MGHESGLKVYRTIRSFVFVRLTNVVPKVRGLAECAVPTALLGYYNPSQLDNELTSLLN